MSPEASAPFRYMTLFDAEHARPLASAPNVKTFVATLENITTDELRALDDEAKALLARHLTPAAPSAAASSNPETKQVL